MCNIHIQEKKRFWTHISGALFVLEYPLHFIIYLLRQPVSFHTWVAQLFSFFDVWQPWFLTHISNEHSRLKVDSPLADVRIFSVTLWYVGPHRIHKSCPTFQILPTENLYLQYTYLRDQRICRTLSSIWDSKFLDYPFHNLFSRATSDLLHIICATFQILKGDILASGWQLYSFNDIFLQLVASEP